MYFPTICVDNFFDDPDKIRNIGLIQDYSPCYDLDINWHGAWPGVRSKPIHEISKGLHDLLVKKIFACFFCKPQNIPYLEMEISFHKFPREQSPINAGWVHTDNSVMAGVIYLTPDYDISCGTSLYKRKDYDFYDEISQKNINLFKEQYTNYKPESESLYIENMRENNSHYIETVYLGNVYNRMIAYDGHQYHSIKKIFSDDDKERLTIVFFLHTFNEHKCPIPMMKSIKL